MGDKIATIEKATHDKNYNENAVLSLLRIYSAPRSTLPLVEGLFFSAVDTSSATCQ